MAGPFKKNTVGSQWNGGTAEDVDANFDDIYQWLRRVVARVGTLEDNESLWARLAGGNTFTGTQRIEGQYYSPIVDDGNSGVAKTIDWDEGNEHYLTMTGNCTFTLSNPVDGGRYVLLLDSGAGGFTGTWPASVRWPSGVAPTLTVGANKVDLVTMMYVASLGEYIGTYQLDF